MSGIRLLLLLLPLMMSAPNLRAADEVRLHLVATEEDPGKSRIVLSFSSLPSYRLESSGQRVDLILPGVSVSPALREQSEHGRIIKILYAKKTDELIVSFLLRQPPARILTSSEASRRLVLDLNWHAAPNRTAIAFQVPGVPTVQQGLGIATLKPKARYSADWQEFFRQYQTPLHLPAPLSYSLPALPADTAEDRFTSSYLQAIQLAEAGKPHQAGTVIQDLTPALQKDHPLRPYYRLLEAEIALATGKFAQAVSLLEPSANQWPAELAAQQQARFAAALAKTGKPEAARKVFLSLGHPASALAGDAFGLESAAGCFDAGNEHATSTALYRKLEETLADPEERALAGFAWAAAAYRGGDRSLALEKMKQLNETYSAQEAGSRAYMKLLDHDVLTDREAKYPVAIVGYGALAEQAPLKSLREEAAFKQILVMMWSDQQERSVKNLLDLLRDFHGGVLFTEAEALLTELLPPVIKNMVNRGEDLQAVVLAEQNRQLLMSGGIGWPFLSDLASAFNRMGLPERAGRIYLFMLDSSLKDTDKEALYLPLIKSYWAQDEFFAVASYAAQYLERYPRGEQRSALLFWRLRALRLTDRQEEAAMLLASEGIVWNRELELEAARILSSQRDFQQLAELAGRAEDKWSPAPEATLLQAEALRETGQAEQALLLYRSLLAEGAFTDQAAFRTAQILMEQGKEQESLKILSELVETGKSTLWRRLAEETLSAAAN